MNNLKKLTAVALAAAMTVGSAMTVFAADAGSGVTGDGSFEGGETAYPTLQVTLPTIPDKAYDYIADPNGLIAKTGSASADKDATSGDASGDIKYGKSKFEGDTGLFFRAGTTDAAGTATSGDVQKYGPQSEPLKLKNQNAQDIEVTVKLEQATAGDSSIAYAADDDFSGDTTRKLYIAVTDGSGDPAVLGASPASITQTIKGKKENYVEQYDGTTGKYVYKVKPNATGWEEWSCYMTGALNKGAEWKEDNIRFPSVKVTWSYAEKTAERTAQGSVGGDGRFYMSVDGTNGFDSVSSVTVDGQSVAFSGEGWISIAPPSSGSIVKITTASGVVYKIVVS